MVTPAREHIADPVDGNDKAFVHDPIDDIKHNPVSSILGTKEKVIHMEITKLPDDSPQRKLNEINNQTAAGVDGNMQPESVGHHRRNIRMDLDDEL